ncbi:MAG TPA: divergent PAP2 family protein [Candidatus Pacearchaeota archaeon]|nr:divergent PAP2 family protein [Candidatus Pacearchaeota archaeon]HOS12779.1 divergent PAP2 family protein [Candidatus Pacearchaeota archaeon]
MNDYLMFNKVLVSSILAWFIAQTMKVFILTHKEKKFRWGLYSLPGNFPSSHSAVVSALATGVAITEGIDSAIFAVAVIFAFFIIYDAKVIRGAAGKQAQSLNKIIEKIGQGGDNFDKSKEILGHSILEISGGVIIGIICSLLIV